MNRPNLRCQANRRLTSHIKLTPAEQKTLPLLEKGLTAKAISEILGISHGTASVRIATIKDKLRA